MNKTLTSKIYKEYASLKYDDNKIRKDNYKEDWDYIDQKIKSFKNSKNPFFKRIFFKLNYTNQAKLLYDFQNDYYENYSLKSSQIKEHDLLYYFYNLDYSKSSKYNYFNNVKNQFSNSIEKINCTLSLYLYQTIKSYGHPILEPNIIAYDGLYVDWTLFTDEPYFELLLLVREHMDYCYNQKDNISFVEAYQEYGIVLSFAIERFLKLIDIYFDSSVKFFVLIPNMISKIKKLNLEMLSIINENLTNNNFDNVFMQTIKKECSSNVDYFNSIHVMFSEYLERRNNYFYGLSKLKNIKEEQSNDYYSIDFSNEKSLSVKNYSMPQLASFCTEKTLCSDTRTFENNLILLQDFFKYFPFNITRNFSQNKNQYLSLVPSVSLFINLDTPLDLKVAYREFIIKSNEFVDRSQKKKSQVNKTIKNIMKDIINTLDGDFSKSQYNDKNFESIYNEQDNIRYLQTLQLTEKLRRGFYREFDQMDLYRDIFDLKCDIRKIFYQISLIPDFCYQYIFFTNYVNTFFEITKKI